MLVKIITFNVAHGRGMDNIIDIERQANLIKEYKPDIIFLQEVDMYTKRAGEVNQIREFAKKVGPFETMSDLEADIQKYLEKARDDQNKSKADEAIFDKVIKYILNMQHYYKNIWLISRRILTI